MPLPTSLLLEEPSVPRSAGTARTFRVYGEPDDPLRLTVLLAQHVGGLLGGDDAREAVSTCIAPRSPWKDRKAALADLLRRAGDAATSYAVLVDPDGLVPPKGGWEDRGPARMSRDLRAILRDAIDRGGFLLVRPHPTPTLDDELDGVRLDIDDSSSAIAPDPLTSRFAPDVRPILARLLERKVFSRELVDDLLEEVRDPNGYVLAMAYDSLPETARETARQLSAIRAPSKLNGSFGALTWAANPVDAGAVRRVDVETLCSAGFLVADDLREPESVAMPRRVRAHVGAIARALDGDRVTAIHRTLAPEAGFAEKPTEAQIEIHHHAARAGDVPLATRTARYFGFELRALATDASRAGRYEGAAELFRKLVDEFDPTDAYAWEYLGYNLALKRRDERRKHGRSATEPAEILDAYDRAHQLDKKNPLYFGRLLGQRAEMGLPVRPQFEHALQQYASYDVEAEYVSWFVMPVFDGLFRGGRSPERDELARSWRNLLESCAPKVLEKHPVGAQ